MHSKLKMIGKLSTIILILVGLSVISSGEKKERKAGLKWFPAEVQDDCKNVPGQVEVLPS